MQIIDGKLVAAETRREIAKEAAELKEKKLGADIGLAVIFVGDNPASQVYVRNKIKACEEVGIKSYLCKLPEESSFEDVAETIERLNKDDNVSGMILQLPIPKHLDENRLIDLIAPEKDVDGCTAAQKGRLWTGRDSLVACTPYGVMKLLDFYDIPLEGRNAVVIGRSNLVGKPMAQLLLDRNCTVTLCHSRTRNLRSEERRVGKECRG